jgi:hypothetical protein
MCSEAHPPLNKTCEIDSLRVYLAECAHAIGFLEHCKRVTFLASIPLPPPGLEVRAHCFMFSQGGSLSISFNSGTLVNIICAKIRQESCILI